MSEPDELTLDELCWLASLAGKQRRKRERDNARMRRREDQTVAEFNAHRQSNARSLAWARKVEDHLIALVADIDETALREHQQERLAEIERAAA